MLHFGFVCKTVWEVSAFLQVSSNVAVKNGSNMLLLNKSKNIFWGNMAPDRHSHHSTLSHDFVLKEEN